MTGINYLPACRGIWQRCLTNYGLLSLFRRSREGGRPRAFARGQKFPPLLVEAEAQERKTRRERKRESKKSFCGVSRLMMPPPSIFPALLSCFLSFPLPFISLILRCLPGSPSYPRLSRSRRQFFRRRCQKPALIPSPDSGKRRRRPSFLLLRLLLLLVPRRRDKSSTGESPVSPDPGLYFIAQ